jgi:hypothetical protein
MNHEGETRTHSIISYLMQGSRMDFGLRSTHFTLVRVEGIQTELATYELLQKIRGLGS